MKQGEHLIFVPGFPTNSILLQGLQEYLSQFFTVHFIDLPGFKRDLSPLSEINFAAYGSYVREYIANLRVKHYVLAGASFGFPVVCSIPDLPYHCKAILALEPYINTQYLRFRPNRIKLISSLSGKLAHTRLGDNFFHLPLISRVLSITTSITPQAAETIRQEFDGHTFLSITRLLLSYEELPPFHKHIPHILSVNDHDKTLAVPKIVSLFKKQLDNLLVIPNTIDHWPRENSFAYFAEGIDREEITKALQWLTTLPK